MVRAIQVAKLFLAWANEYGDVITNLKLQKLLYYAQAWHLVNYNRRRLFSDPIEAWDLGPVVPEIYRKWKRYGSSPIPYSSNGKEKAPFQGYQIDFLIEFFRVFSNLSATALVSMSHSEAPWQNAHRRGKNSQISLSEMRDFYKKQYEEKHG